MITFTTALVVFLLAHVLPARTGLKGWLVPRIGRGPYLAAYSAVSLALLAWLIETARAAPYLPLWDPAPWQAWVPLAVMPIAFVLLVAGLVQPNPLSVTLRTGETPGAVVAITRHPVLWGFLLWALAHVPPNGDVVSLVLFGGMALFAAAGMPVLDRRARARLGEVRWRALATGAETRRDTVGLVATAALGLAVHAWFLLDGHARFVGVDPLARIGGWP